MVQRGHVFGIVDEVDSILIDEARTPLIISGQGDESTDMYEKADRFVSRLKLEEDYTVAEKEKAVSLTEEGVEKAQKAFNVENIADLDNADLYHYILNGLKAHAIMKRDVDYVVQDGEVIIVDEFTGRLMIGRRYSDGLHQAIEAKEHVKVNRESQNPRHHHVPELLPHVQEDLRHDRHGQDRGRGVPGHLQPGRRADSHQHAHDPQGHERRRV